MSVKGHSNRHCYVLIFNSICKIKKELKGMQRDRTKIVISKPYPRDKGSSCNLSVRVLSAYREIPYIR